MGLDHMFSDYADFSQMLNGREPLKVSKVVQKAFIEVNEEGAEAAAATGKCFILLFFFSILGTSNYKYERFFIHLKAYIIHSWSNKEKKSSNGRFC